MFGDGVGIEGAEQRAGERRRRVAAGGGDDLLPLRGFEFAVEPREARGERGERVFIAVPEGDAEQQLLERHGGLAVERAGFGLVALAHADGIDDDEVGLGAGVFAGDGLQIGGREHAGAAPFHLLEIDAAANVAQEEEALERLDVGAGGDHVHGDGDAERGREAELAG